ncbi:hypothetical protein ACFQZ4_42605 [Catellatospora coxensis]|uniref:Uncharacterized protein n=1 Tax=Catellatospora coxensis TaxID=310354 RepID=A0A8J3L238_9ACTN|nr:hypothetical protein [Catellatospora coxensis]GIG07191.1 hypothetical protein Cco03nite_38910 [Catellatospora coxensis]
MTEPRPDQATSTSGPARFMLALCVLMLAGAVWLIAMPEEDTDEEPVPQAQAAAECLAAGEDPEPHGTLVERLAVQAGDDWLRLYVADGRRWVYLCEGNQYGHYQGFGSIIEEPPTQGLHFFGGWDAVAKPKVLMGALPAGATAIEARLVSGEVLRGTHDGTYFAIWSPDATVEGATVTATGADGKVIATAPAPVG